MFLVVFEAVIEFFYAWVILSNLKISLFWKTWESILASSGGEVTELWS